MPAEILSQIRIPRNFSGYAAVDVTGKRWVALPGIALRSNNLPDTLEPAFSWDARRIFVPPDQAGMIFAPGYEGRPGPHPHVLRIDTLSGGTARLVANPGRVTEWVFERGGRGALGVDASGSTVKLIGLRKPGEKWVELGDLGEPRNRLRFHAFDSARGVLYLSRPNAAGRWAPAAFKLNDGQWTPPFVESEHYDLTPAEYRLSYANIDLTEPLFSPKTGLPVALSFVGDGPRQQPMDAPLKAAQQQLSKTMPGLTTFVIGLDNDEKRALTFSWSARQPGIYSIVDLATQKATHVADRMSWLSNADLAEMFPIKFKARDGVELDAYLTMSGGAAAKQLPLVLLLREHPWQREAWGFQPLVQFLATRGYAVLQVNYRGSSGYGDAFMRAGREDIIGVMQDDIIDAVRWAIAKGTADPQRIAVVGTGFGGASALIALARAPELFRCAAAINPVTDWRDLYANKDTIAYRYWFDTLGMFPADQSDQRLRQASPIVMAERITQPLLLIHSSADTRIPIRGFKAFASAMKKAGRAPETFYYDIAVSDRTAVEKKQIETYDRVAAFLARNVTPTNSAEALPGRATDAR